jgi:hypothetical protein
VSPEARALCVPGEAKIVCPQVEINSGFRGLVSFDAAKLTGNHLRQFYRRLEASLAAKEERDLIGGRRKDRPTSRFVRGNRSRLATLDVTDRELPGR